MIGKLLVLRQSINPTIRQTVVIIDQFPLYQNNVAQVFEKVIYSQSGITFLNEK
jgi:hypothetical protein